MAIKVSGTEVISDDKRILNNEDLPDIRPSLLLDFANSKTLDPRITFTRGSTATYWDGKTTAKAEENLFTYSQEINQWNRTANVTVTANSITAPDGTTTADTIAGNTATSGTRWVNMGSSHTGNATYSFYAKAGTNDYVQAYFNTGGVFANFDLSTGVTGSSSGVTSSIVDVGDGWYRCIISNLSDTYYAMSIQLISSSTAGRAAASTLQTNLYLWGAQKEIRDSATAYTATTSSPIVKYQPVLQTAASGEARFDHDPVTGESKGLLIEEARTNRLTYSEAFDNAVWVKGNVSVLANTAISPDGTLTADKIFKNNTTSQASIQRFSFSNSPVGATTYSFYAKAAEYDTVGFTLYNPTDGHVANGSANLTNGTVNTTDGTIGIENAGNGWWRISGSGTNTATTGNGLYIYPKDSTSYQGNSYSGIYIWGAQVEEGSFPTSYIPTSGSTVTRAVEYASITGDNFSSFFSNQVGTIYCEYGQIHEGDPTIGERLVTVYPDNGTVKYNLEAFRAEVRYEAAWDGVNFNNETRSGGKVAVAFDDTGFSAASLGVSQGSVTRQPYSQQSTKMYIGSAILYGHTNACIPKIAIYPKRLPNATLQAMTEE